MKTGIIRRVDDLGRIVIPKEIRRSLNIREGEAMEIETTREGKVVLSKYVEVDDEQADEDGSPVRAVKVAEPKKYYIDVCDRRVFTTLEDIIPVMESNGDITSFEEFLCQEYTAGGLYDMYATHGVEKTEEILHQQYVEYSRDQAQDLLDSLRDMNYIEVYI